MIDLVEETISRIPSTLPDHEKRLLMDYYYMGATAHARRVYEVGITRAREELMGLCDQHAGQAKPITDTTTQTPST